MRIGIGTSIVGQQVALTGYLDDFGLPTAAYSVRKVVSTYTDAVVEVRRTVSAVTVEADVAFDGDTITLDSPVTITSGTSSATTLGQFVAASGYTDVDSLGSAQDAFVTTWYDQAGSNHATQATAGSQPKIYDASTGLVTENGKVALDFDGSDDHLRNTSLTIAGGEDPPLSSLTVGTVNNATINQDLYGFGYSDDSLPFTDFRVNSSSNVNYRKRSDNDVQKNVVGSTTIINNTQYLFSSYTAGTTINLYLNGASEISSGDIDVPSLTINQFSIGALWFQPGAVFNLNGTIQELIFYNTDKSSVRTDIEGNINGFFDIYTP